MRSRLPIMTEASVAGTDKNRATLARMIQDQLRAGETILAILPFTNTQKRPKKPGEGRKDKVRTGVYQSWRRYRPLVLTDRRLFVFEIGPHLVFREALAGISRSTRSSSPTSSPADSGRRVSCSICRRSAGCRSRRETREQQELDSAGER